MRALFNTHVEESPLFDTRMWVGIVWHYSSICATWLIHICDMTHLCARRDTIWRAIWLIHTCDMTHPYVRHDSSIRATWLYAGLAPFTRGSILYMCIWGGSAWRDSFICDTIHMWCILTLCGLRSIHTHVDICGPRSVYMLKYFYMETVWRDSSVCDTSWIYAGLAQYTHT